MAFKNLIKHCRSYRRFYQDYKINEAALKGLVGLARLSASAANLQPLKYILSFKPTCNNLIFPALRWAGYLKDWPGPKEEERPSAYIIILGDRTIAKSFDCDCGIACQSILLGAVEKGLGGCIIGSIDRNLLRKNLKIRQQYDILVAIALGRPKEKVKIEKSKRGDIKYYRDKYHIHHVPKRPLSDIIIKLDSS